jgi:hypothetical protein
MLARPMVETVYKQFAPSNYASLHPLNVLAHHATILIQDVVELAGSEGGQVSVTNL